MTMSLDFPVDPVLPEGFDSTPNEERLKSELDAWWDRPFATTNKDGTFSVQCLHGGAWDRPSWLGNATTLEEAKTLADQKLKEWKQARAQPRLLFDDNKFLVFRTRDRPDQNDVVLGAFDALEDAAAFIQREFS